MRSIFSRTPDTLDITLLAFPELSLLSLAATLEPLRAANRASGQTLYTWRLVSSDGCPVVTSSGLLLPVQGRFAPDTRADALIILAAFNVATHATPALIAKIRKAAQRVTAVGGVESGSWVMAKAGLLDGRRATTHWEDLDDFAASHPATEVLADRFVVDGNRFTTGGASPALDMILHLIRARQGYALALEVASIFIYEEVRAATDPQPTVSLGRLDWSEPRVSAAIRAMESHMERPVTISAIARTVGVSVRMLEMLFRQTVGMSPRDCYLNLRLKAGRRMVLDTRKSITEIATQAGFASASTFARRFRANFGESPGQARRQQASAK
jgi:transcriptional regulator GlxA family with amidase domain